MFFLILCMHFWNYWEQIRSSHYLCSLCCMNLPISSTVMLSELFFQLVSLLYLLMMNSSSKFHVLSWRKKLSMMIIKNNGIFRLLFYSSICFTFSTWFPHTMQPDLGFIWIGF